MRRQRLRQQRPRRHREVVRHRDDLELVRRARPRSARRPGARVSTSSSPTLKTLPGGGVGLLEREQQRVREVLGVAVVVQRQPVVGHHDAAPAVEDAAHDEPLARHELVRPVHVRVAEVRGARDGRRTPPPPCARCGSPSRPPRARATVGASSATGTGRPSGSQSQGFIQPRYAGTPPTETNWPHAAGAAPRCDAQPAVHRDDDVEGRVVERVAQRVLVVRVGVHVLDRAAASRRVRGGRGAGS